MNRCPDCNKLLFTDAKNCSRCGWKFKEDHVSFWLCFLSFLCSAFGIIYWIVAYRQTPRRATACGVTALFAPVVIAILLFLLGIIILA